VSHLKRIIIPYRATLRLSFAFRALTLLVGGQEGHLAHKNFRFQTHLDGGHWPV